MITKEDVGMWSGLVIAVGAALGAIWNRFGVKELKVKTDGLLEWRSRADRAEGKLDEIGFQRDQAAQKMQHDEDREDRKK